MQVQGQFPKDWDSEELFRCGARGTGIRVPPNLDGEIHPVFRNWVGSGGEVDENSPLRDELHQPLLLATRLLEFAGLTWLSEFCIDDVFGSIYPGQNVNLNAKRAKPSREGYDEDNTPKVIARHHRAAWLSPQLAKVWLDATAHELRTTVPNCVQWKLDTEIFPTRGWVGYTCRYSPGPQKGGLSGSETAALDFPEAIRISDERARTRGARSRLLTVLVMEGYASRLRALRRLGLVGGEEYLCTAFMAAVTMLHELGHVMYWRDFRAINRRMTEPYFGGDLEMELGDSFVASIFGGWVPVPIATEDEFRVRGTFEDGLAWRQHLSWDTHRTRPGYRIHYSIPVAYISRLFNASRWKETSRHALPNHEDQHASAALADFELFREKERTCRRWKRKPAADFRIPYYQNFLIRHNEEKGDKPVPEEPEVCDKVLSRVQIRLNLPNSEIFCLRQIGPKGVLSPHRGVYVVEQDFWVSRGIGLDLRKLTGKELRVRLAEVLGLLPQHLKLSLEDEEGTEIEVLDRCMLCAYARQLGGGGLALRLSLDPG